MWLYMWMRITSIYHYIIGQRMKLLFLFTGEGLVQMSKAVRNSFSFSYSFLFSENLFQSVDDFTASNVWLKMVTATVIVASAGFVLYEKKRISNSVYLLVLGTLPGALVAKLLGVVLGIHVRQHFAWLLKADSQLSLVYSNFKGKEFCSERNGNYKNFIFTVNLFGLWRYSDYGDSNLEWVNYIDIPN